jgi:hypothetical protein
MRINGRAAPIVFRFACLIAGIAANGITSPSLQGQQSIDPQRHVVIASLANASKPSDLDYQAGECDMDPLGKSMGCVFQQVFLNVARFDAETCLITTNRYELTFQKQVDGRWVSNEGPAGDCGVMDVTTLENTGGARWTMDTRKSVSRKDASPSCREIDETPEILSWQNVRRNLPCKFVQPGAMSR